MSLASSSFSKLGSMFGGSSSDATPTNKSAFTNHRPNSFIPAIPTWMENGDTTASSSSRTLPPVAGSSTTSASSLSTTAASAAASASTAATAAAAHATAAASKAASTANEWFGVLSAKVQGKEYVAPTSASAANAVDLESGAGGGTASGRGLLSESQPAASTGFFSGLTSQFTSELSALSTLSWRQRLIAFGMSAIIGIVMMFLAFSFLPMVFLGAPAKFAISYALANIFLLGASCFLIGPMKQLSQMFSSERMVASATYLGSLLLTFYVSWQYRSFFLVIPVLAVSFASLLYWVATFLPFGQTMIKRIFGLIASLTIGSGGSRFSFLSSGS